MKNLTQIGLKFGTDKAEYHEFTEFYEDYFAKVAKAQESPRILEIGILDGGSLKMYDEYFRGKAKIVGIDIQDKSYLFPHSDNVLCLKGDVLKPDAIEKCRKAGGAGYDIIIDDGNHTMEQQQKSLKNLWSMLKPGGYFIIEDLHTSGIDIYNPEGTITTLSILEGLGEGEFRPSLYINEEELKALEAEMETCIVAKNDFPQVRTASPRTSITSMIQKKLTGIAARANVAAQNSEPQPTTPPKVEPAKTFADVVNKVAATPVAPAPASEPQPVIAESAPTEIKKAGMLTGQVIPNSLREPSVLSAQADRTIDEPTPERPNPEPVTLSPSKGEILNPEPETKNPETPKRPIENVSIDELNAKIAKS